MIKQEINLISDTITRPTPEMLDFMTKAKVGDDVSLSGGGVLMGGKGGVSVSLVLGVAEI